MKKLVHKFFPRIGMLIVLPLLAFSALMLHAQEASPEPTTEVPTEASENPATEAPTEASESPVATELPTEVPSIDATIELVTEEATLAPITEETGEAATEIPATDNVTEAPATSIAPEPPFTLLMRELFDNGDTSPWNIGSAWSLVPSGTGQAFQIINSTESLELLKGDFYNVAVQASFLADTADARLSIRNSAVGNYSLSLSPDGTVELYRSEVVVASALATASTSGQWRILRVSAVDGLIRASVDGIELLVYTDSAPLPPGTVRIFSGLDIPEANNILLMDDFFLWVLVDELANYPAPTAYWLPTEIPREVAVTELAPTSETNGEVKDYSPFPPPTNDQLAEGSISSTLGNDNWGGLFIPDLPYIVEDNTVGDTLELGEPLSGCGVGMSNTVWFELNDIAAGSYRISSSGSNFDTILAVYQGSSVGTLTQVACNDDISATDLDSQMTLSLGSGTYFIQLGGFNGRYGNYRLTVQLLGLAAPTVPSLSTPANAAKTNDVSPTLSWAAALNVYQYELQVATNSTFTNNLQKLFINDPTTNFTLADLPATPGTVYYWRVRAINGSGVASAFSAVRNFTLDTVAPNTPNINNLADNAIVTNSRPTFNWGAVTGASGYSLIFDNNSDLSSPLFTVTISNVNEISYVPSSLRQGTYYWQLRSRDAAGNYSPASAIRSFTIKILSSPANNEAIFTAIGEASPVLRWVAVPDTTAYTVQIDDDTDFSADLLVDQTLGNVLTYTVLPALPEGVYYWQVIPIGREQSTAVYSSFIISPPALVAPSLLLPAQNERLNDTSPDLSWTSVASAYQYEVQWATNATFTANVQTAIVSDPTTSLTLPSLPNTNSTIYYWRVRTINNLGARGAYSAARNFTLDTTPTAAANLVSPANGVLSSNSRPTFSFQAVTGATDYFIDIDNDSDFSSLEQSHQFFATSFTLTSSLPQGTYYWRIRVQDAAGNISTSATRTITIKILTAPANNTVIITGTGDASPVLQWAAVVEAAGTGYTVQIDDAPDFSTPILDLPVGNVLTYTVSPALTTGVYYWQVFPTGSAPAIAVYSQFTISPPALAAPSLLLPAQNERLNDTSPELSWTSVASAYQYEVQWATNATFTANAQSAIVNDPTTSHTLPALPNTSGTSYYWRVRAINLQGVAGSYSAARTFILDTNPLSVPNLTAPANAAVTTNSRPMMSWAAVTGATYLLDLDNDSDFSSPIELDFVVTNASYTPPTPLIQGTYYWRVQTRDNAMNPSAESAVRSFTVKILSSPANNAIITSSTPPLHPVLSWVAVTGATSYTIQIDDDTDFSADLIETDTITGTNYTVLADLGYGIYYWQVIPTGFEQTIAVYNTFTISPGNLAAPALLLPANNAKTNDVTPDLLWNSVGTAYQYEVQWATNTAFTANMGSAIVNDPSTTHTLPALANTPNTVYYWRVRTINQFGVAGPYSAYRNFVLDTVAPNVPVLVSPANGSTTMTNPVQFRWNASAGAFRYELRYGTNNPPDITITNLATTSYTSPSPMLLQSYYWQVRAVDAAGNASAWTALREIKINSGTTGAPILNRYTSLTPTLSWTPISWTSSGGYYQVQVDNNLNFSSPEFINNAVSSSSPTVTTTGLSEGTWYWRVRACNVSNVCGAWSTTGIFVIEN